jgi:hypothetical protein
MAIRTNMETPTQTLHRLTSMEAGREWDDRQPTAILQVRTRVSANTMLAPRQAE